MVQLAANIDWLWKALPLEQRLAAAHRAGFKAVEALDPYVAPIEDWKQWLTTYQLKLVLINAPSGSSADVSVRGLAAWPGKEEEFQSAFTKAMTYAQALGVPLIHATAGPTAPNGAGDTPQMQQASYEKNLAWACTRAQAQGMGVTIEPLSPRDARGAFMASLHHAMATIAAVGHPALKLQFDLYHQQILHGDIIFNLRSTFPNIGHIQVAGVPDRTEPDLGELDFGRLARELSALGYTGYVGCEYRPAKSPEEGLHWARPYL
jgi:hydroxypyruvate isomerase